MHLKVSQEGYGPILLTNEVPAALQKYVIPRTNPLVIVGNKFDCLMQEFASQEVSNWYNRMWAGQRCVINLEAPWSALELRMAVKGRIRGTWDGKTDGDVPPGYFQFNYVPHIATRAIFDKPGEYRTNDLHYKLPFLENSGVSYPLLDKFIEQVRKGTEPVEMLPHALPCSEEMLHLVNIMLRSEHSDAGYAKMIGNHMHSILIAALEEAGRHNGLKFPLTIADKQALHEVRDMITLACPEYLSNIALLKAVFPRLNESKLNYGFPALFGMSPYEYYQRLRFDKAKSLLETGQAVTSVAFEIGYGSPDTFIREFKNRFHITPKAWTKT